MDQDRIEVLRHKADALQAEAELNRLDAESARDDARRRIDEEQGIAEKRAEFKKRLSGLKNSVQSNVQSIVDQYKSDWEGFKSDTAKRYDKADRLGKAKLDLLSARIDGLAARIQYLVGVQLEESAKEAREIQRTLEPVVKDLHNLSNDVRAAFQAKMSDEADHSPPRH